VYDRDHSPEIRPASGHVRGYVLREASPASGILPPNAARAGRHHRDEVLAYLGIMHAKGFLDDAEYEARVADVTFSRTMQELSMLESDLPLSPHRARLEKKHGRREPRGHPKMRACLAQLAGFTAWGLASGCVIIAGFFIMATAGHHVPDPGHPGHEAYDASRVFLGLCVLLTGIVSEAACGFLAYLARPLRRLEMMMRR
jgi:Domain of unknown function (DUF1707)